LAIDTNFPPIFELFARVSFIGLLFIQLGFSNSIFQKSSARATLEFEKNYNGEDNLEIIEFKIKYVVHYPDLLSNFQINVEKVRLIFVTQKVSQNVSLCIRLHKCIILLPNSRSLGDLTNMEGTQMEIFNFLWLILDHYLPLTPTKND
jgi:hypothetical protein